jgi:hypothetical protein
MYTGVFDLVHVHVHVYVQCHVIETEISSCDGLNMYVHVHKHELVDVLGGRLETEMEGQLKDSAGLCYICSGNVEKFVEWW